MNTPPDVSSFDYATKQAIANLAGLQLLFFIKQNPTAWTEPLKRRAAHDYIKCVVLGTTSPRVFIREITHEGAAAETEPTTKVSLPWILPEELNQIDICIMTAISTELQFSK